MRLDTLVAALKVINAEADLIRKVEWRRGWDEALERLRVQNHARREMLELIMCHEYGGLWSVVWDPTRKEYDVWKEKEEVEE